MVNRSIEYTFDNPAPVAKYFVKHYEGNLGEVKLYAMLYWAFALAGNTGLSKGDGPSYRLYEPIFKAVPYGIKEASLDIDEAFYGGSSEEDERIIEESGASYVCDYVLQKVEKMNDFDLMDRIREDRSWSMAWEHSLLVDEDLVILEYQGFLETEE